MKINLVRTGGIIPVVKKAATEVDWGEKEISELLNSSITDETPGKMRDSTQYQLAVDDKTFSIDLEKVPPEYKEVFDKLKDDLQIVKPG